MKKKTTSLTLLLVLARAAAVAAQQGPPCDGCYIGSSADGVIFAGPRNGVNVTGRRELPVGTTVYLHVPDKAGFYLWDGKGMAHFINQRRAALRATIVEQGTIGHPSDERDKFRVGRLAIEGNGQLSFEAPLSFEPPLDAPSREGGYRGYFLVTTAAPRGERPTVLSRRMGGWPEQRLIASALRELSRDAEVEHSESEFGRRMKERRVRNEPSGEDLIQEFACVAYGQGIRVAALKRYFLDSEHEFQEFDHILGFFRVTEDASHPAVIERFVLDEWKTRGPYYIGEWSPQDFIDESVIGVFDLWGDGSFQLLFRKSGAESEDIHIKVVRDGVLIDPGIHFSGGL